MYNVTSLMSSSTSTGLATRRHVAVCSVCGDKASGKHYGVMSCDGCRGFFKRSVRRKIEYKCKGDSTCQVDVNRRNQCQACRFQRCLAMKMKPSAVQNERAPRQTTKRAMPSHLPPPSSSSLAPPSSAAAHSRMQCWTPPTAAGYVNESPQVTRPFAFRNLPMNNVSSPLWSRMFHPQQAQQQSFNSSLDSNGLHHSISSDEMHSSLDVTYDDKICETASFILLESIRWLYLVPSFKELLEHDQYLLIDQSWSIVFLLTAAETKKFLDESDSFDDENHYVSFQSIVKDLIRHGIDSTEYTLLKLIAIFHAPINMQVQDRFRIDKYRKDALFMLTEYTRNSKYRRLAELLMLLSNIQENMGKIDLETIFFRHLITRISMENLLHKIIHHLPSLQR